MIPIDNFHKTLLSPQFVEHIAFIGHMVCLKCTLWSIYEEFGIFFKYMTFFFCPYDMNDRADSWPEFLS